MQRMFGGLDMTQSDLPELSWFHYIGDMSPYFVHLLVSVKPMAAVAPVTELLEYPVTELLSPLLHMSH